MDWLLEEVQQDIRNIEKYTRQIIGSLNVDSVFGGVVSLEDFAVFVYYECFAGEFLHVEEPKALHKHVQEFQERYAKKYFDNIDTEDDGKLGYYWLQEKDPKSLSRRMERNLRTMLKAREVPEECNSDSVWESLASILQYHGEKREKATDGYPMKRGYFYQLITQACIQERGVKLFHFMSNSKTSAEKLAQFYSDYDEFIQNFMMVEFQNDFLTIERKDELDAYIAQSINLFSLEDRCKLHGLYELAVRLTEDNAPDLDTPEWKSKYVFGPLPPMFAGTISPYMWYWETVGNNLYFLLSSIFCWVRNILERPSFFEKSYSREEYTQLSKQVGGRKTGPGPILWESKYLDLFLEASDESCRIEELRYYTIQILTQYIIKIIHRREIEIYYSNAKFGVFLHSYYNLPEIYAKHIQFRKEHPMNKKTAAQLRKLAAILDPLQDVQKPKDTK